MRGNGLARLRHLDRADIWLAVLASVVLGAMMVFIFVSAVLRYAFNTPIVGANEALGLAAVAMVMLGLPHVTARNTHIRIDLMDNVFGPRLLWLTELLYRAITLVILWFLVRSYLARALDAYEFEDSTNMLSAPIWPFYALVGFGMAASGLILAGQLLLRMVPR